MGYLTANIRFLFLLVIVLAYSSVFVSGQDAKKNERDTQDASYRISDDKQKEKERQIRELVKNNRHWFAGIPNLSKMNYWSKPTKRDRHLISIHPDDRNRYKKFLNNKSSGVIRLHDIARCDEMSRYLVNVNCTWDVIGKAASFSFRTRKYTFGLYSDIQYRNGQIEVYGLNLLGFITELGDVPLESLSLKSGGIAPMFDFQPSWDVRAVKDHIQIAKDGFRIGEFSYKTRFTAKLNTTYAVRSIAYEAAWSKRLRKVIRVVFGEDRRGDVIAVFRVIRKHDDGSVTILWRRLSIKEAPIIHKRS